MNIPTKNMLVAVAFSAFAIGSANATNMLPISTATPKTGDTHLTWHAFQHELFGYAMVNASMSNQGVVTLNGHVDGGIEKNQLERLARNIADASLVVNLIQTD